MYPGKFTIHLGAFTMECMNNSMKHVKDSLS